MLAYAKSDIGMVRKTNEDNYVFLPPRLFAVADGMGGHVAGEIASKLAADTIREYVAAHNQVDCSETVIKEAIQQANWTIFQIAQSKPEYTGMGTTVSAVIVDGPDIFWAHVGDSRIYLLHDRQLKQLTDDHSLVGDLVRNGNITPEEALTHPHRNILTRAVGTNEDIQIDTGTALWEPGDMLLLCTDGLTNMVSDGDICQLLLRAGEGREVLDQLVREANAAGGLDNITGILLQNGES
ncbi:protein phosphatase 2c [Lucifera butyrica]|uniref:Protein phosphatase 2c n=1 Tax=Lucifera butyrica TaxID=1351585 RepID=A0A498R9V4_9FIRM|nr:Stp1/IreP family PP2C-type Ser/Thr phosphatase [Lucifera butyrica]VBB07939.1 protein phosphatase 2c [Lucifera butyrica]